VAAPDDATEAALSQQKPKALVGNAADEEQVIKASEKEQHRRRLELEDLSWVLSDRRGRRVIWRLMERFGAFGAVWDSNASAMGRKAAWQECGQYIKDEVMEARSEAFLQMLQEHSKENANA